MKKLLSILLCIVFVCFSLVGCAEDVIGDYLKEYETDNSDKKTIEPLNFYIITGNDTSGNAETTVEQYINSYLAEKYEVELDIIYCTQEEYAEAVYSNLKATNADGEKSKRPDIVLINSKEMFDKLHYEEGALVALNDFYNHRDFKKINTIVDRALLSASTVIDPVTGTPTYYTVPNNHIIGEYSYIVIDKAMARDILHFSNEEILSMTTTESIDELKAAISAYYNSDACDSELTEEEFVNQFVKIVSGTYNERLLLEYGVDNLDDAKKAQQENALTKNFVNVKSYPVATKDEAFRSAFAIVKQIDDNGTGTEEEIAKRDNHYNKCMQIIFGLNNDAQLLNMLQYGYVGTTFRFDKNDKHENTNFIKLENGEDVIYRMNPIHTGNIFKSYYCNQIDWNGETFVWNEENSNNILKQNADSYQPTADVKLANELEVFALNVTTYNSDVANKLPIFSNHYNDITVAWSVATENEDDTAVIEIDAYGNILFTDKFTENTTVTVVATISCSGVSVTKNFEITLVKAEA